MFFMRSSRKKEQQVLKTLTGLACQKEAREANVCGAALGSGDRGRVGDGCTWRGLRMENRREL